MLMILPPQYKKGPRLKRQPTVRERWLLGIGGLVVSALIAVTIFSLTSHQPKNGHGCLSFNYATVLGGEQAYVCGAQARKMCASPPHAGSLGENFEANLRQACLGAKFPYATAS